VPDTSIHAGSLIHTTPVVENYPPSTPQRPPQSLRTTLTKTNLTKTNNYKTISQKKPADKFFEPFWEAYRKIPTSMRVVSQSKKLAKAEFSKLGKKTQEKIFDCLQADIRARKKQLNNDNFTPLFPDCFRYLKNGQYEQYLLTLNKKPATFRKPKLNTPF